MNKQFKEMYIDLEIINYYLILLNDIHDELKNQNITSLYKSLPSTNLIMKLMNNLCIIRFKLLKEIINKSKISNSEYKKIKFNSSSNKDINKLFNTLLKLTNKYVSKQNKNKENNHFLNFILDMDDLRIIEYTIEQIGNQFEKIMNTKNLDKDLYNRIENKINNYVDVVYTIKYKFECEFL